MALKAMPLVGLDVHTAQTHAAIVDPASAELRARAPVLGHADDCIGTGASAPGVASQAFEMDEDQASAGAQSAPTALLHLGKATTTLPLSRSMQLGRAGGELPQPRCAPPFVHVASVAELSDQTLAPDEERSVDRTGLDYCSSMQCGGELGEGVLFDDSGQRR